MIICVKAYNIIYSIKRILEEQQLIFNTNNKTIGNYDIINNTIIYFLDKKSSE
jgi:hypothetical protein